jgi:uncharacterized protein (DUF488 family)
VPVTPIYTIGYGSRSLDAFRALLERYGIAYLIDVRSRPYSRFKPEFSREALERQLAADGIRYVYMGDLLGGQPAAAECYDAAGKVDYAVLQEQPFYRDGIGRLRKAAEQQLPVGLLCSEEKPEQCHRAKLIGVTLEREGITVAHIDANGELVGQEEVMLRVAGSQPSLFGPDFSARTSRKRYRPGEDTQSDDDS